MYAQNVEWAGTYWKDTILTCRQDERAVISASNMASGGAGSGGGGMEVLGTLMVASLAGGGPWGAFPPVEFGLRIGRGFGGMSKDEHRRDGGY